MESIASDLIANIEGYQQLLTTLSLGICAGVFALITQIVFHNVQNSTKIYINGSFLLILAVVFQVLAIASGVATKSALVASVPALHQIQWGDGSATTYLKSAGLGGITFWSSLQIAFFGLGVITLLIVLICNVKHLTQR